MRHSGLQALLVPICPLEQAGWLLTMAITGKDFDFGHPTAPEAPKEHQFRQQSQIYSLPEPQQKWDDRVDSVQPRAGQQQPLQSGAHHPFFCSSSYV